MVPTKVPQWHDVTGVVSEEIRFRHHYEVAFTSNGVKDIQYVRGVLKSWEKHLVGS